MVSAQHAMRRKFAICQTQLASHSPCGAKNIVCMQVRNATVQLMPGVLALVSHRAAVFMYDSNSIAQYINATSDLSSSSAAWCASTQPMLTQQADNWPTPAQLSGLHAPAYSWWQLAACQLRCRASTTSPSPAWIERSLLAKATVCKGLVYDLMRNYPQICSCSDDGHSYGRLSNFDIDNSAWSTPPDNIGTDD